ncbi:MAG: hypothetical protein MHPSP_001745, partial [Paramarteilia canceri]
MNQDCQEDLIEGYSDNVEVKTIIKSNELKNFFLDENERFISKTDIDSSKDDINLESNSFS